MIVFDSTSNICNGLEENKEHAARAINETDQQLQMVIIILKPTSKDLSFRNSNFHFAFFVLELKWNLKINGRTWLKEKRLEIICLDYLFCNLLFALFCVRFIFAWLDFYLSLLYRFIPERKKSTNIHCFRFLFYILFIMRIVLFLP